MTQPNPFDELLGAWRRLGEESMHSLRQAFEAGSAQWQRREGAPHGEPPSQPPTQGEPSQQRQQEQPSQQDQQDAIFGELRALRSEVAQANERLQRIEAALRELTLIDDDGGSSPDDDDDDDDDDHGDDDPAGLIAELEKRLRRLEKRGKKGKR